MILEVSVSLIESGCKGVSKQTGGFVSLKGVLGIATLGCDDIHCMQQASKGV